MASLFNHVYILEADNKFTAVTLNIFERIGEQIQKKYSALIIFKKY